jgi:hypothetical protein
MFLFNRVLVVLICYTYLLKVGDGPQDVDPERSSPARQMKSPEQLCLEMLKKDREETWHDLAERVLRLWLVFWSERHYPLVI